ncbi:hypothetical protein [Wuhan insect virus 21]|uniref:hypothetical protein n=1 Tax=Wuhan insect virus 21 TaxID=1923725 RepID=UPI00090C9282|nr:hypothetical protein [Wuhan insect virus 21]APG76535.1 hypothetical protein [Wuhan insect virus 21]
MPRRQAVTSRPWRGLTRAAPVIATRRRVSSRSAKDFLARLGQAFNRVTANPIAIIAFAICAIMAVDHAKDPLSDSIKKVADALIKMPTLQFVGEYLKEHIKQTVGAVAMGAAVLVSARPAEKTTYLLGTTLFSYIIPEYSIWAYGCYAAALTMLLQLRRLEDRLLIAGACFVIYVMTVKDTDHTARVG